MKRINTKIKIASILIITLVLIIFLLRLVTIHDYTKHQQTESVINMLQQVLTDYYFEYKRYPSTEQGLIELVSAKKLNRVPRDSWGNEFHYLCPGIHNKESFDIWSLGADNAEGGRGENADINNW